jgi:hypothetical protein
MEAKETVILFAEDDPSSGNLVMRPSQRIPHHKIIVLSSSIESVAYVV